MTTLLTHLQTAERGDLVLSAAVWSKLLGGVRHRCVRVYEDDCKAYRDVIKNDAGEELASITESLDAAWESAMRQFPDTVQITIQHSFGASSEPQPVATYIRANGTIRHKVTGMTPALAICAALVAAKEADRG